MHRAIRFVYENVSKMEAVSLSTRNRHVSVVDEDHLEHLSSSS